MGIVDFVKEAGEKLWDNLTHKNGTSADHTNSQGEDLKNYLAKANITTENLTVTANNGVASVSGTVPDQATKEKVILTLGNVAGIHQVEDHLTVQNQSAPADFYTVKSGDTLSAIAKTVYGDANAYMKIFEANKPMLSSPEKIYPGQVLRIPK